MLIPRIPRDSLSSDKFDLNKLTEQDIQGVRTLLGIMPTSTQPSVLNTDDPFMQIMKMIMKPGRLIYGTIIILQCRFFRGLALG